MKTKTIKTVFHTVIFAYVYLMIALIIPTNYSVTAPNRSRSANTMIQIDGMEQSSNLKSISVLSMNRITGFARMIYQLSPELLVTPLSYVESTLTTEESSLRGIIQKNASYNQALISAYELASTINVEVEIHYEFIGMTIDYRDIRYKALKIGDIITDINDIGFTNYEAIGLHFINNDGIFNLKVLRDDAIIDVTIDKKSDAIFSFYPKYEILSATPSYSLPGQHVSITGPSAGMMYTLSIYYALIGKTNFDEVVVGTGTIRYNNEIGQIGGLRQKIYGAYYEGIKHFLLPASQYHEVSDLSHLMNLYPVTTITDAIMVINDEILN